MAYFLLTLALAARLVAQTSGVADAAERKDAAALRKLIAQHANVNEAQADGTTALHWAAHWNDLDSFNLLLRGGANAKAANRYGATPLSEAAAVGNAAMVEALLKAGADPNTLTTADGETVLMTAARAGQLERGERAGRTRGEREREGELSRADGADVGRCGGSSASGQVSARPRRGLEDPLV